MPLQDHEWLVVTPLGAAMGIGASCFRVEIGPYEVVLDCGTRPKGDKPLPALEYLQNPDLLLISHAHLDHIGAVPVFHNRWPGVRMICTPGTREIAHIMLQDCLKVQQANEDSSPLFDESDLERTLFRLETEPMGQDFEPLPGLIVRFINAGHIVGAACIYLRYSSSSLLYTGDYNTTSSRTTTGLRLAELPQVQMLITEATYGADTHPARQLQETALLKAIATVVQAGGNVLIPAFALGRAQEILLALRTSMEFHKLSIPIYVDGLVRAVTDTFRSNLELLPPAVQNLVQNSHREPFFDDTSTPKIIPIAHPRERPLAMAQPSVIIASSGMLSGGASVYYAKTLLERENAAIFISGYTDEESPGRLLQQLQTGDTIELDGSQVTVRAQIQRFNLSAHADKVGLTQVIARVNPKHLVLIHGSLEALHQLSRAGDLRSKHYIHIARVGEPIAFGVAPKGVSVKQIARLNSPQEFEVEVMAEVEGAWIRIPESVVAQDPRWRMLAGTGVMQARWDGLCLKLSPVDELPLAIEAAVAGGGNCCANCQDFELRTSRCLCLDSPLAERVVDPAGYCLEYRATTDNQVRDSKSKNFGAAEEPDDCDWEGG
ncbi:MAG: MBL fold metallo-hydrolase [Chroococcidiopsidaceae cyanobacterium CP_BM_ER_R8_30]|nr:MBL fold metallo-hydrolase [Chroococcidiopsidaceae cyanobacterium CP_BM_ER_R8_30]